MKTTYFKIILLLISVGCAGTNTVSSSSLGNLPGASPLPGGGASPNTSTTLPSGKSPLPAGGACSEGSAVTTTGGCINVKSQFTTILGSNQTFSGLASDSSDLYMLVYQSDGGGINHWLINRNSLAGKGWTSVCSILDDGNFRGGLAYDGTYFYITAYGMSVTEVRKFSALNCAEAPEIIISYGSYYDVYDYIASDGGSTLYLPLVEFGGYSYSAYFNSSSGNLINSFTNISFAGRTANWSLPWGISFGGGQLWAILPDGGGSNPLFWKFNPNGSAIGWSNLVATGNSFLSEISALTVQSASTAIVMTNSASQTQLQFSMLDISGF